MSNGNLQCVMEFCNEQWKSAMCNGNLQCAMEICNEQWKSAMCNGNVQWKCGVCLENVFNVQWKCGVVCGVVLGVCSVVRFVWCVMCCSMKQAIHLFVGGITIL